MTEKLKRKNNEPIPRRYWWLFGILAIVLLIGLRFPVRILYWWQLNPLLYGLIMLACIWGMVRFIRRYHWQSEVVILMLVCTLLACIHFPISALSIRGGRCYDLKYEWRYACNVYWEYPESWDEYIAPFHLPIGIFVDFHWTLPDTINQE